MLTIIQKNPFNAALAKEKAKADLIAGANKKLVEYKVPKGKYKSSGYGDLKESINDFFKK